MKIYTLFLFLVFSHSFGVFSQEKPSAENTGTHGNLTEYTGTTTITTDGTVLENLIINGTLNIRADNVTVRNCLISTGGIYGIRANYGFTSLLVEDCEIKGMRSAGILADNFTMRRCNIWDSGADAIKAGENYLIEDCWLHDLGYIEDAHADGIQMVSGGNGIIRGNYFDMPYDAPGYRNSQCIIIQTNNSAIDNVLIEDNWINGGGFSVQIRDKEASGFGPPTNISIINNLFGRNHQFGTHTIDGDAVFSCNRWEDTGELIGECDSTLSVDETLLQVTMAVFPNPVSDRFTIQLPIVEAGLLSVYSIDGRKVFIKKVTAVEMIEVQTDNFSNGIYLVDFESENLHMTSKVIVAK